MKHPYVNRAKMDDLNNLYETQPSFGMPAKDRLNSLDNMAILLLQYNGDIEASRSWITREQSLVVDLRFRPQSNEDRRLYDNYSAILWELDCALSNEYFILSLTGKIQARDHYNRWGFLRGRDWKRCPLRILLINTIDQHKKDLDAAQVAYEYYCA